MERRLEKITDQFQQEKETRRHAEENELNARHERESELDRRLMAESRLEELQYQRDATEAELRALEQKCSLLEAGVSGVHHRRVEIAGMDRHKLERDNKALEEEVALLKRNSSTQQEAWTKESALLQQQVGPQLLTAA